MANYQYTKYYIEQKDMKTCIFEARSEEKKSDP